MDSTYLNEDNDLLCRQLLRIVAQVRAGAHVESSNVSIARAGTLTIYTVQVSLEESQQIFTRSKDYGTFEDTTLEDDSVVTFPAGGRVQPSNNPILNQILREKYGPLKGDPE